MINCYFYLISNGEYNLQLQRLRNDPNAIYGTVDEEGIYATADIEGIYEMVTPTIAIYIAKPQAPTSDMVMQFSIGTQLCDRSLVYMYIGPETLHANKLYVAVFC